MNCAIYLRKSRADAELERRGEGETLARHRATLLDYAQRHGLNVACVYEEIVSGESIVSRPQMQALMAAVERGEYDGVLVMEIERLARGDTMDQGLVAQTFKYSGTKIITPLKTYDPADEFDEEFFEFGLFMSRREYKTINRRLKQGLYASAKEGKWLSPKPPYGYLRVPLQDRKGTTLAPVEEQAAVVRLIFDLYVNGIDGRRLGHQAIAHRLNELGIPAARRDYWTKETIRDIVDNPVYAGKIRYGYRRSQKKIVNGERINTRPVTDDEHCVLVDGLHEAIVSPDLFAQAQALAETRPIMPVGYKKEIKNPLAGLIICKCCGRRMAMRRASSPYKPTYLVCHFRECPNVSAPLDLVEEKLLDGIESWVNSYKLEITQGNTEVTPAHTAAISAALDAKKNEAQTLSSQLSRAYDLLEQGVYSPAVFAERSAALSARIAENESAIAHLVTELAQVQKRERLERELIPHVVSIMDAYRSAPTPAAKNALLREILDRAVYYKETSAMYRGVSPDDFTLEIYPKLPPAD